MVQASRAFDESGNQEYKNFPYIVVAESHDGSGDIHVHDLTVRIPGHNGRVLIKDLDMTLKKGEKIILTGESGSGKTTVAKALLNQWDHGSGLVVMPAGAKIMAMSQQAYFPNTTIRGILNLAPEGKEQFTDSELADALRAVGHEKLVQQIPGQQVEVLIHDLIDELGSGILAPCKGHDFNGDLARRIRAGLAPAIEHLVHEQFNYVQYVPQPQREKLNAKLAVALSEHLQTAVSPEDAAPLTDDLVQDIDRALVRPLYDHLATALTETTFKSRGRIIPYTPGKADYFAHSLEKKIGKRLRAYMANKDTDDLAREIRLNKAQAIYLAEALGRKMREELQPHIRDGALSQAFNAATWPLSLETLNLKAGRIAGDLIENLTFFMDRQIVTGDRLTLSGGERQKLMIAMALLHKPDILILDEITAALDRKTAESLYRDMIEKIPADTTVISIAHNEHIIKFHTIHAHLENQTITLTDIKDGGEQAPENNSPDPCKPGP